MDNSVERTLEDQKNIVELQLALKKLKFKRKNNSNNASDLDNSVERTLEDQKNIVELQLALKKLKFKRKKKPSVKVFE